MYPFVAGFVYPVAVAEIPDAMVRREAGSGVARIAVSS
jgi:hypothetical protein